MMIQNANQMEIIFTAWSELPFPETFTRKKIVNHMRRYSSIIRRRLMTENFSRAEKGTQEYSTYLEQVMDELKHIKSTYESRKKASARYRKEASKIQDAYSELRKLKRKNDKLLHADENESFDRKALKEWFKKKYKK